MIPRWTYSLALLLTFAPWSAWGRDIHVNNVSGDDHSSGSVSISVPMQGPVRTICRALAIAEKGDRIVLANTGMAYRESIGLSASKHCGFEAQPFVIEGNGAVLDGSRPIPYIAWEHYRDNIFRFQPKRLGYQQLFLGGRPAKRVHLDPQATDVPELQPLEWCVQRGAIFLAIERDKAPADYDLSYAALHVGITLHHVHDVAISNLVIQGFQLDGINAHDGTRECVVSQVVVRGNGRSGICTAGCSQLEVHGCIIGDNGTAQVRTEAVSATSIVDSDVLENTAPAFVREGGLLFVDGQRREP